MTVEQQVANMLNGKHIDDVYMCVSTLLMGMCKFAHRYTVGSLHTKYGKHTPAVQRMILGNLLRAQLRRKRLEELKLMKRRMTND